MPAFYDVSVMVLSDRNATVAEVSAMDELGLVVLASATGAAKRENGDRYNQNIALDLAVGRALENLGRQLRRRGEAAVKKASDGQSS